MENKKSKLVRKSTYLKSPLRKGNLITPLPGFNPDNYQKLGQKILSNGQKLQTGYDVSSFLKSVYELNEPETREIQEIMSKFKVFVYQTNFWLPEKEIMPGMYSVHDSKAQGMDMEFNRDKLEAMLDVHDTFHGVRYNPETGVAFAPRSTIKLGLERDWKKFATEGSKIAIFLPEGAQNLADLGKENFNRGYTFGVSGNDQLQKSTSVIYGEEYFHRELQVENNIQDKDLGGFSWGKTAEQLK